jgi:hypothetical protein
VAAEVVRILTDLGPAAVWLAGVVLGLVAVCLIFLGIALVAVLRTTDISQQQYRYQAYRDLVDLIRDLCRCKGQR